MQLQVKGLIHGLVGTFFFWYSLLNSLISARRNAERQKNGGKELGRRGWWRGKGGVAGGSVGSGEEVWAVGGGLSQLCYISKGFWVFAWGVDLLDWVQ